MKMNWEFSPMLVMMMIGRMRMKRMAMGVRMRALRAVAFMILLKHLQNTNLQQPFILLMTLELGYEILGNDFIRELIWHG